MAVGLGLLADPSFRRPSIFQFYCTPLSRVLCYRVVTVGIQIVKFGGRIRFDTRPISQVSLLQCTREEAFEIFQVILLSLMEARTRPRLPGMPGEVSVMQAVADVTS